MDQVEFEARNPFATMRSMSSNSPKLGDNVWKCWNAMSIVTLKKYLVDLEHPGTS